MPAITLPNRVKRLRGTFQPSRANPNEPTPSNPLGDPPVHLARDEKAAWRELARITVPGMLTEQDRWCVEVLCQLMAKLRRREDMANAERAQLTYCLSHCGLTPSDRAKVVVTTPAKPEDDFSQFIN